MAKFCTNCGAQMNDSDQTCSRCGASAATADVLSASPAVPADPLPECPSAAGEKKGTKTGLIIGITAAAAAVLAAAVILLVSGTGYKGTVRKFCAAIRKGDADAVVKLESPTAIAFPAEVFDADEDDVIDALTSFYEDRIERYEDKAGTIKKVRYEIKSEKPLKESKLEDLIETLDDDYDFYGGNIKEIVKVKLKLTIEGDDRTVKETFDDFYLIREKGGWKICYNDSLSGIISRF